VAFCYFETLVRTAEPYKFREEVTRLKSFNNIMNAAGFDEDLYVDFADEAYGLLEGLAGVSADVGLATLLEAFNVTDRSMSIITYLKVSHPSLRYIA
jgi:ubiquitin thioesterase protein OTUB1